MKAAELNSRVIVQQMAAGVDTIGQPVQTWSDFATLWANIRLGSGAESIKAGADTSVVKAGIRIRFRADLNTGMRVVCGPTTFAIKAVMPDLNSKKFTDLSCEVVV